MANRNDRPSESENNFMNPIGSLGSSTYRQSESSSQSLYSARGTGGSVRHQGYFSQNNPYFNQLQVADNNQDIDALYELAIQWEADYANRQMQLEENKAILDEQREYDSPVNQAARMRAAGINPDLEGSGSLGSGSGSGSAQLTNPGMADQTGQTKFSNKYDNTALVFEGINTAASTISALSGSVGTIMNAVSTFKTLPSQIALNEANAGLADAKANEISQLLGGNKEALSLANAGKSLSNTAQSIQNTTAVLQQLAAFSNLIAPDTTDFAPILQSLGVSEQNIAPYSDIIKQMHANPQMRDKYAKASTQARWSEAENAQYTDGIVAEMTEMDYKIKYEQQHWQYQTTNLKNKISAALNTDTFVDRTVSNEMDSLLLQGETIGIKRDEVALVAKQLKNDTEAYLNSLKDRAATLEEMDKTIALLEKSGKQTPYVKAQIDRIRAEKIALRGLLSNEFNQIKTHYLVTSQQLYNNSTLLDKNNDVLNEGNRSKPNFFSDVTFNDLIYHTRTPGQIANQWVNTGISAVGVVVDAVGTARGFDFNSTYREVHGGAAKKAGYNEGWSAAENYYK